MEPSFSRRLLGIEDDLAAFDDDADTVVAAADRTYADFVAMAAAAARNGLDLPSERVGPYPYKATPHGPTGRPRAEGIEERRLVHNCRLDFGWIDAPLLDTQGAPIQDAESAL